MNLAMQLVLHTNLICMDVRDGGCLYNMLPIQNLEESDSGSIGPEFL
jgi:hypothetical protein